MVTEERPLSSVCPLVAVTVDFLAEGHFAVGAGEGLFTRVNSLVLFESADGAEAFLTDGAHIRFLISVHAFVFFKVRLVIKTHFAVGALKWSLPRVDVLMAFEVSFRLKAAATQFTAERSVPTVRLHVDFEGRVCGVSFLTNATGMRPQYLLFIPILVHFHVPRQKRFRHQLLSTDTAGRDRLYSTLLFFTLLFLRFAFFITRLTVLT